MESVEYGKAGTAKADKVLKTLVYYRYRPVLQICTRIYTFSRRWPNLDLKLRVNALSPSLKFIKWK